MGIVDGIIQKWKEKNSRWEEAEEDDRVSSKIQERKLSHNERELNKILEQERQNKIKNQLKFYEMKRRKDELQRSRSLMKYNSNWFKPNKCDVLRQPNLFVQKGRVF